MNQPIFASSNIEQPVSFPIRIPAHLAGTYTGLGRTIFGTADTDTLLRGSSRNDSIFGLAGDDTLLGDRGNDMLYGGAGDDIIRGGQGDDRLFGDQGNDVLYGDLGTNFLTGGLGQDTFVLAASSGGIQLSDADLIIDFAIGTDLIGLADGLEFQDLSFIQVIHTLDSTDPVIESTAIRHSITGAYLAILKGITATQLNNSAFTTDLNPIGAVNIVILPVIPPLESEAGTPAITETASPAVVGSQTVNLAVSDTGIPTSDFTDTIPPQITIADVTSGSFTVNMANDVVVAETETATFAIVNPSSDLVVSSVTSDNVTITDNDLSLNVINLDNGNSENVITVDEALTYTIAFSQDIDAIPVAEADFGNADTATVLAI
jgi:RTX calcium-binding nonapeptide repeat (4 copies)